MRCENLSRSEERLDTRPSSTVEAYEAYLKGV